MPLFQIVHGVTSGNGTVIKPGDIVDWTEDQAKVWYPNIKGSIRRLIGPEISQTKLPEVIPEATVEPVVSEPYQEPESEPEPEPEPLDPEPKPEKRSKKHYRGR